MNNIIIGLFSVVLNTIKKLVKSPVLFCGVFLAAFLPQLAFADDSLIKLTSIAPPVGDLSVALLGKIFGTVGGGLETAGPTIFGQMFYIFNSGILITIGVILIYTTVKSVMEVAHGDVGQMSRKFNWWQMARVVLGAGAVVPQATGYSFLNTLVIWVVIQGVGLADAVWKQAVTYVSQGGAVYFTPGAGSAKQLQIDKDLIFIDSQPKGGRCEASGSDCMTAANVLNSLVCMDYLYNVVEASRADRLMDIKNNPQNYTDAEKKVLQTQTSRFHEAYTVNEKNGDWFVEFPGNADKSLPFPGKTEMVNLNGLCGRYAWGNVPVVSGKDSDMNNYRSAKEMGVRQMVLGLSQIADNSVNLYKDKDSTTDFPKSFHETAFVTLASAAASYQSIIQPMRLFASNGYDSSKKDRIDADALTKDGWIGAGSFYFTLSGIAQTFGSNDNYYYVAIPFIPTGVDNTPPWCDAMGCNGKFNDIKDNYFSRYLPSSGPDSGEKYAQKLRDRLIWMTGKNLPNVFAQAQDYAGDINAAARQTSEVNLPASLKDFVDKNSANYTKGVNISVPSLGITSLMELVVTKPLNAALNNIFEQWYKNFIAADARGKFPILQLQILGQTMIDEFFAYWSKFFTNLGGIMWGYLGVGLAGQIASIAAAPYSALGLSVGASLAIQYAQGMVQMLMKMFVEIPLTVLLPLAGSVTLLFLVNGVILAYYIPLLPFMLFLFGVISWFSFVIEGMVAAPLVALGITHPEGHDLMGKAEQALMLLVSIFIRPTVMIFGLFAGMVLSYVAMDVLNAGFGRLITSIYYGFGKGALAGTGDLVNYASTLTGKSSDEIVNIALHNSSAVVQVQNVAMILIYTLISMALVQQCFSLIHILPNAIMNWIGGPKHEDMAGQLAEGVKGGLTQAAERSGASVGESARGLHPGSIQGRDVGAKKDDDDKGGGASVTPNSSTPSAGGTAPGGGMPPPG